VTIFRKNQQHQQSGLFETVEQLPERHRLRLENSWGGAFYRELFCRIDETLFAKLYSENHRVRTRRSICWWAWRF